MSSIDQIAAILSNMNDPREAHDYLVAQCAQRKWAEPDTLVRIGRMCAEVAQAENQVRGRRQGSDRAVAGSTRVTVVRDFAARVEAGASYADAWSALCAEAELGETGAGGRPRGTRSDAASAFRAMLAGE